MTRHRSLPIVTHVTLTSPGLYRRPVDGVYQFHAPEDATAFAVKMRDEHGYTATLSTGPLKTEWVRAGSLTEDDRLADNVMITRVYYGRTHVRVTGIQMDTVRRVRRSYRLDQAVEIEHR
jgi:hypothetical protein